MLAVGKINQSPQKKSTKRPVEHHLFYTFISEMHFEMNKKEGAQSYLKSISFTRIAKPKTVTAEKISLC
jgi:hypothetical protein